MKYLLIIGFVFVPILGKCQVFSWEKIISLPGMQSVKDITQAFDGNFIAVGNTREFAWQEGIFLKIDSLGDTLFTLKSTPDSLDFIQFWKIEKDPYHPIYHVLGIATDSGSAFLHGISTFDQNLFKLSSTYFSLGAFGAIAGFEVLPDRSFLIWGDRQNPGTNFDVYALRIDSMGQKMWEADFPRMEFQETFDQLALADGSYLIGANSFENVPAPAGELLLKIDHQGNLIDSSYLTNNTIYNHSFMQFALGFNGERNQTAVFFDYPNGEFYDKQFIKLDSQLWALNNPKSLFYPHVLRDSTINVTTSDQNKLKPLIISNSGNIISSAIGLNTNGKSVTSSLIDPSGNLYFGGNHFIANPSQSDFYFAKFSGIGQEYIPDFCLLSPPQAWFGFEYDGQTLTLRDSSFAGMIYHDSVYKYEWFFQGIPLGINTDSFSIPYDTTIQPSNPEVKLVIHNFYRCSDTLTLNLPLAPTGLEQGPLPDFRIQAWPNPTQDWINLKFPENSGRLVVLNSHGEVVFRQNINNQLLSTDISQWAPGIYFFRYSLNGKIHVGKIVKN
jgi:Secretion system C-terminal sorting domain